MPEKPRPPANAASNSFPRAELAAAEQFFRAARTCKELHVMLRQPSIVSLQARLARMLATVRAKSEIGGAK